MFQHDTILTTYAQQSAGGNPLRFLAFARSLLIRLYYLTVSPGQALDVSVQINLVCSGLLYSQFQIDGGKRRGDINAMIEYVMSFDG